MAARREPVHALGVWAIEHIACIRAALQRFDAGRDRMPNK